MPLFGPLAVESNFLGPRPSRDVDEEDRNDGADHCNDRDHRGDGQQAALPDGLDASPSACDVALLISQLEM